MDPIGWLNNFIGQSQRVLTVTHKPNQFEFRHIASSTAIGMALIGVIGLFIAYTAMGLKYLKF